MTLHTLSCVRPPLQATPGAERHPEMKATTAPPFIPRSAIPVPLTASPRTTRLNKGSAHASHPRRCRIKRQPMGLAISIIPSFSCTFTSSANKTPRVYCVFVYSLKRGFQASTRRAVAELETYPQDAALYKNVSALTVELSDCRLVT